MECNLIEAEGCKEKAVVCLDEYVNLRRGLSDCSLACSVDVASVSRNEEGKRWTL